MDEPGTSEAPASLDPTGRPEETHPLPGPGEDATTAPWNPREAQEDRVERQEDRAKAQEGRVEGQEEHVEGQEDRVKRQADPDNGRADPLQADRIYHGDCRQLMERITSGSVALSVWSPPYFVGKSYERQLTFDDWQELLQTVLAGHTRVLREGGFVAINIADILCFSDPAIPRFQAEKSGGRRLPVSREDVERVFRENPGFSRYDVARVLGVSEQTVDRRMKHNNIRGGKYAVQTRVQLTGGLIEQAGREAGLVLYDRRVWVKDPAWENSRWHTNSYRAVDEFEYIYVLWKPGITKVNRQRLTREEWVQWGSRAVWQFPSVRHNNDHEAKFPLELPRRLIRLLTEPGDLVLDPFVGSGTTALAAIREGRHYLGIDSHLPYVELARRACREAHSS